MSGRPITDLKGIGEKTAKNLSKLGIETVEDLVKHLPARYLAYDSPGVIPSTLSEDLEICILASPIKSFVNTKKGKYTITSTILHDGVRSIKAVWFNSPFVSHTLREFYKYVFIGKITKNGNTYILNHPTSYTKEEYQKISGKLRPLYPLTKGITNNLLTKAMERVFEDENFANLSFKNEFLPKGLLEQFHLQGEESSYRRIHFPNSPKEAILARKRLAFDEFFWFLYHMQQAKTKKIGLISTIRPIQIEGIRREFESALPFRLTQGQTLAIEQIYSDMESQKICNRLIQGDVGSGKTVVAVFALLAVVQSGYQGAIMVPTEVLARQHYKNISDLVAGLKQVPRIGILTGSMKKSEQKVVYSALAKGEIDILIGTHALIEEKVVFHKLGLVITDEQHRFGVRQRQLLAKKGENPHILVMSATPIPRTLAVILYGDLDVTHIESKPVGRLAIKNAVIDKGMRQKAYEHIAKQIRQGHQAYVICPLVEESEGLEVNNVLDYTKTLQEIFGKEFRIAYLHGRMKESQKNEIMLDFAGGEIDILVSTTVIEVGVDVANATVILIEDAQRFGLATLHQLRGRVGRSALQSYCIFVCTGDKGNAKERLAVVGNSNDGFFIANEDLRLRGPGEIFGMAQSGEFEFEIADIYSDSDMLKEAKKAVDMFASFPMDELQAQHFTVRYREYQRKQMERLSL